MPAESRGVFPPVPRPSPQQAPRLLSGSTIVEQGAQVHLIAGEDFRFTIQTGDATAVVAHVLRNCRGDRSLEELLAGLAPSQCDLIRRIVDRLRSERVLFEAPASPPLGLSWRVEVVGTGSLSLRAREAWQDLADAAARSAGARGSGESTSTPGVPVARVLVQQELDLARVLEFNREAMGSEAQAWLWVTTGPLARGYVSPVILRGGRPCLECLLRHFRRLSPAPQLYDVLERPGASAPEFTPAEPDHPLARILLEIAGWKLRRLEFQPASSSQFALHVVEGETLETRLHPVWLDPTCPVCGDG